ncbi:hypothetical protein LXL04_028231 [Taraxacum kok-saghyz]
MSKKMKTVAFDSSSHVSYDDARARIKHQTLLQDFVELQQETEAQKNNLMALKGKKLTLQAEVRFLRQRYKFLINNKSSTPQEQSFAKPPLTRVKKSKKEKVNLEKPATLHKIEKKKAAQIIIPSPDFKFNPGNSFHVKEQSVQRTIANQRIRINGPKINPFLDSIPKVNLFKGQEPVIQKKPVIDLNRISREEEELQDQCELFDHHTNVRLSMFKNVPDGSGSGLRGQAVKRKISWQDPVALSVWGL